MDVAACTKYTIALLTNGRWEACGLCHVTAYFVVFEPEPALQKCILLKRGCLTSTLGCKYGRFLGYKLGLGCNYLMQGTYTLIRV